jgi:hypothetical protein
MSAPWPRGESEGEVEEEVISTSDNRRRWRFMPPTLPLRGHRIDGLAGRIRWTGVAPVSDIAWTGFSGRSLPAANRHLLVRQEDEDGDRRDACPTPPATPSACFLSA